MIATFLNIAGIIIGIESEDPPAEETNRNFCYGNFVLKNNPPKVDIKIALKIIPEYRIFRTQEFFKFERELDGFLRPGCRNSGKLKKQYPGSNYNWRIGKAGKKILIEGVKGCQYQLLISGNLSNGQLFKIGADNEWRLSDIINGCLQVLVIYYMAKRRIGLLVHSAGIKEGRNGYLFAGLSRAGKSTTSRIWRKITGVKILNDDRVIIRKDKNDLYMYPTPWCSSHSDYLSKDKAGRTRLSKFFYIYHRERNLARRLNYIEGFSCFFKTLFLSFWDKECVNFSFDFLLDILSRKPCYKFGFKNDERIVNYIKNLK